MPDNVGKNKYTHIIFNTSCFSTAKMVIEAALMLYYMYFVWLSFINTAFEKFHFHRLQMQILLLLLLLLLFISLLVKCIIVAQWKTYLTQSLLETGYVNCFQWNQRTSQEDSYILQKIFSGIIKCESNLYHYDILCTYYAPFA